MDIFNEQMEKAGINLSSVSKSSLRDIADTIISSSSNGDTDPLMEYIKAKGIAELSSMIVDGLKDLAIDEASKYSDADTVLGCKIQVKNISDTYDFSHDDEWNGIKADIDKLKAMLKQREEKMIDAMKYSELVDENGEVIPPATVKKFGGSTIAVTIPR